MPEVFEFIVIGAGAMGVSTAYHLARAGRKVLIIEQYEPGHKRGASHGESRIIRLSYDHPTYIEMARQSYGLWRELESLSQERLLYITGGLDLANINCPILGTIQACLRSQDVDFECLDNTAIKRRFPQFSPAKDINAIYQSQSGFLLADRCLNTMLALAQDHGAQLASQQSITSIEPAEKMISVRSNDGVFVGEKLIITGGPWSQSLLQQVDINIPIKVTQEQFTYIAPAAEQFTAQANFPVFIFFAQDDRNGNNNSSTNLSTNSPAADPGGKSLRPWYGLPAIDARGVKIAFHKDGPLVTADARSFQADRQREDDLQRLIEKNLPALKTTKRETATCLYSMTPDEHFILDRHPQYANIVFAAGFSGHGFKFSILIGKMLKEIAESGSTKHVPAMFKADRFQSHLTLSAT